ncbi:hypothetical protein C1893_24495 [Pseudomonas sp. MPR-ANC1]|nr:hypothetical protein C1893_24495 [Pseudomonas sp. MPR-ANC1]
MGFLIVPTLCVGMSHRTLRVRLWKDAERPRLHSHAERGNERCGRVRREGGCRTYSSPDHSSQTHPHRASAQSP